MIGPIMAIVVFSFLATTCEDRFPVFICGLTVGTASMRLAKEAAQRWYQKVE